MAALFVLSLAAALRADERDTLDSVHRSPSERTERTVPDPSELTVTETLHLMADHLAKRKEEGKLRSKERARTRRPLAWLKDHVPEGQTRVYYRCMVTSDVFNGSRIRWHRLAKYQQTEYPAE